jgi:hypothetical protein
MNTGTEITVMACERWFHTGFPVVEGDHYRIKVPSGQIWTDWWVESGPAGHATPFQNPLRRFLRFPPSRDPRADFFTLIGTIGESLEHAFVIGAEPCDFQAPVSGELVCFANDLWLMYWNNRGSVRFTIAEKDVSA